VGENRRGNVLMGRSSIWDVTRFFFDRKTPISRRQFFEKYDICNTRPSPKHLKVGRDFQEEEVKAIFGLVISRNGY